MPAATSYNEYDPGEVYDDEALHETNGRCRRNGGCPQHMCPPIALASVCAQLFYLQSERWCVEPPTDCTEVKEVCVKHASTQVYTTTKVCIAALKAQPTSGNSVDYAGTWRKAQRARAYAPNRAQATSGSIIQTLSQGDGYI